MPKLSSLSNLLLNLLPDALRFIRLSLRSHCALAAENLFLRKQLRGSGEDVDASARRVVDAEQDSREGGFQLSRQSAVRSATAPSIANAIFPAAAEVSTRLAQRNKANTRREERFQVCC
jgi:hypothetical protein